MLTITLLSLMIAAASGYIAWRSIRREHLRSDARVASLAEAMDDRSLPPFREIETGPAAAISDEFRSEMAAPAATLTFEAMDTHPIRRRLLSVLIGASVVVASIVMIAMMSDRYEPPAAPVVSPYAQSLELLSLEASRDGSTLAVTGLVRSRADEPLTTITAVVSAIDAKGRPIGRGSVPLTAIMPRGESRFVVKIGDVNDAARYRVSFRSATGVVRHVDRRGVRASDVS